MPIKLNKEKFLATGCLTLTFFMFIAIIEIGISNFKGETFIWIQPLATFLNCSLWTGYGFLKRDNVIIAPNIAGIIIGFISVIVLLK